MFDDIKKINEEAKTDLMNCNKTLNKGEEVIEEGNDNNRAQEIIDNIELFEQKVNKIYDAINTINASIDSLNNDVATSISLRQEENKADEMNYEDSEDEEAKG